MEGLDYETENRSIKVGKVIGALHNTMPEAEILEIAERVIDESFDWDYIAAVAGINAPSDVTKQIVAATLNGMIKVMYDEELLASQIAKAEIADD